MKKLIEYITLVFFVASLCWFVFNYYQKYNIDQLSKIISKDNQRAIESNQNFLDKCLIIEEMKHYKPRLEIDIPLKPDSVGILWYDKEIAKLKEVVTKISMLYANQGDWLSISQIFQDKISSNVVFGVFDYENEPHCITKIIDVNGKEFIYKEPITITLATAKIYTIKTMSYNYNSKLAKIDTTLIAARTLQLN